MIGCFYDHGQWVALHLESHPQTGDTLVVARVGECPGDADGRDVPLARRPSAGAALDRALRRLTAGWRHACDEPAPPAIARAAIARPAPLRVDAARDRAGTPAQARAVVAYATTADRRGSASSRTPPPAEPIRAGPPSRPTDHPHTHTTRRTLMSLTASPFADAPYAATIHAVELDDFGHSFRPVAPGPFTCAIDVARLEALDDRDDLRAVLRAGRGRQRRVDHVGSALEMPSTDRR